MKTIFQDKWKMREKRDYSRQIAFFNRYSLLFHALLACMLVFVIEVCSRRSLVDACVFLGSHSFAFFFNALIIFFTMSVVYLFRRRMLMRIIISCFCLKHNCGDLFFWGLAPVAGHLGKPKAFLGLRLSPHA